MKKQKRKFNKQMSEVTGNKHDDPLGEISVANNFKKHKRVKKFNN